VVQRHLRSLDNIAHPRAISKLNRRGDLSSVGARGFEPPTFCSQIAGRAVAGALRRSQRSRTIGVTIGEPVQRSEVFTPFHRRFTSPVLQSRRPSVDGHQRGRAARGVRSHGVQAVRQGGASACARPEFHPRSPGVAERLHRGQTGRRVPTPPGHLTALSTRPLRPRPAGSIFPAKGSLAASRRTELRSCHLGIKSALDEGRSGGLACTGSGSPRA
jgi:hypothetical protein